MLTATTLFYPSFLSMVFILTVIFIPRNEYKQYLIYGLLVGGLGDVIVVGLLANILHVMWFKNLGIFNVYGQMALSPPSWTLAVMLFLYFMPSRRSFLYPYVATWAASSVAYAVVVKNAGLYDFLPWMYPIPMYFSFLGWWSFAAWLFIKTSPLVNNNGLSEDSQDTKYNPVRFKLIPQPAKMIKKIQKKTKLRKPIKVQRD